MYTPTYVDFCLFHIILYIHNFIIYIFYVEKVYLCHRSLQKNV